MPSPTDALRTPGFADPQNSNSSAEATKLDLFSPYRLGGIALDNRMVMAPMTRSRALDGNVANPIAAKYYAQRAAAGLIVTEPTLS